MAGDPDKSQLSGALQATDAATVLGLACRCQRARGIPGYPGAGRVWAALGFSAAAATAASCCGMGGHGFDFSLDRHGRVAGLPDGVAQCGSIGPNWINRHAMRGQVDLNLRALIHGVHRPGDGADAVAAGQIGRAHV